MGEERCRHLVEVAVLELLEPPAQSEPETGGYARPKRNSGHDADASRPPQKPPGEEHRGNRRDPDEERQESDESHELKLEVQLVREFPKLILWRILKRKSRKDGF